MKLFIYSFFLLGHISCTSQESQQCIQKISFYQIEMNLENPNNSPSDLMLIEINKDKIYKIYEKYHNENLISADTLKIIPNDSIINKIFQQMPPEYFQDDKSFGYINTADEGALGVTIEYKNGEQIFWTIGIPKKHENNHIKALFDAYNNYRRKLK